MWLSGQENTVIHRVYYRLAANVSHHIIHSNLHLFHGWERYLLKKSGKQGETRGRGKVNKQVSKRDCERSTWSKDLQEIEQWIHDVCEMCLFRLIFPALFLSTHDRLSPPWAFPGMLTYFQPHKYVFIILAHWHQALKVLSAQCIQTGMDC